MRFRATPLLGALLVELTPHRDERGFFARSYCREEFAAEGLCTDYPQCNISYNRTAGTLRGMHYETQPEPKLVRCVKGAVHDVIADLRPGSPSRLRWFAVRLDASSRAALYVPAGFAHGFLTLEDDCEVFYQMGAAYRPECERGFRFDDPLFGIEWPTAPRLLSERDAAYPPFDPERDG
jgi:dTDP-4-dehydrorhamnose 3,5-epimerase